MVVAIDTRYENGDWYVYLDGGRTATGIKALDWAQRARDLGAGEILLTSMNNDGTRDGFALDITARLSKEINIPVIASGGAGTMDHFRQVFEETDAQQHLRHLYFILEK